MVCGAMGYTYKSYGYSFLAFVTGGGKAAHRLIATPEVANEADATPEEIVEHLAELGFHAQDDDPEDDGLDDVLEDAPSTPPNYYGDHPGCKITKHKPKPKIEPDN